MTPAMKKLLRAVPLGAAHVISSVYNGEGTAAELVTALADRIAELEAEVGAMERDTEAAGLAEYLNASPHLDRLEYLDALRARLLPAALDDARMTIAA
jgi:hypothetical protein